METVDRVGVLGAGPHGREIARRFQGLLYDDFLPGYESCEVGVSRHRYWVIGAAWPKVRRQIAEKIAPIVAEKGPYTGNSFVAESAVFSRGAEMDHHVFIGENAVISHGCRIGSFVQICAGACLGGEVTVEDDVFIGMNATIIHGGITLGHGSVIGAGAVVTRNVPPNTTVAGNPARIL